MTEGSVRGAGKARGGATDTTMLIWKVIEANPGITRAGIWERVEKDIPPGYAIRLYGAERKRKSIEVGSSIDLGRARGYVLTLLLINLRESSAVSWEGERAGRRYTVVRQPCYYGNKDAIDVTGTKAADHMAVADALRIIRKRNALVRPGQLVISITPKQWAAVMVIAEAQMAKGPTA